MCALEDLVARSEVAHGVIVDEHFLHHHPILKGHTATDRQTDRETYKVKKLHNIVYTHTHTHTHLVLLSIGNVSVFLLVSPDVLPELGQVATWTHFNLNQKS